MFRPVVQVVHVSDLHFAFAPVARVRGAAAALGIPWDLIARVFHGFAGHDPTALRAFVRALDELLRADIAWPTVLASTGDHSTWGDRHSLDVADRWLSRVARRRGIPLLSGYGNHDVWPSNPGSLLGMPWGEGNVALGMRRTDLRNNRFRGSYPNAAASFPLKHLGGHLSLCLLDSVIHERLENTFAVGRVREDRYWDQKGPDQLVAFNQSVPAGVRVALMHHPITGATGHRIVIRNGRIIDATLLENAPAVAGELASQQGGAFQRTANVCLAGHTHEVFPAPGSLPSSVKNVVWMRPLQDDQIQLTTGTLSQVRRPPKQLQHFQLLRFFESDSSSQILIERIVYERDSSPHFKPFDVGGGIATEDVVLDV